MLSRYYLPNSAACLAAALALSAALFSSLALPPFGLFFSCLELGLATNSGLGAIADNRERGKGKESEGRNLGGIRREKERVENRESLAEVEVAEKVIGLWRRRRSVETVSCCAAGSGKGDDVR